MIVCVCVIHFFVVNLRTVLKRVNINLVDCGYHGSHNSNDLFRINAQRCDYQLRLTFINEFDENRCGSRMAARI